MFIIVDSRMNANPTRFTVPYVAAVIAYTINLHCNICHCMKVLHKNTSLQTSVTVSNSQPLGSEDFLLIACVCVCFCGTYNNDIDICPPHKTLQSLHETLLNVNVHQQHIYQLCILPERVHANKAQIHVLMKTCLLTCHQ